ncbi:hypothetical protein DL768_007580 [Monosporascus sp. mg162]|nr:hypothetical protein DL768_007580 [Monosporascus sp. mg162]
MVSRSSSKQTSILACRATPADPARAVQSETAKAECISDDALIHLRSYKYSAVDKSPISNYVLRHWWNFFVELLPLWLAPNMVTLIGFMFILANIGLLEIFMPDLVGPGPPWLYLSFAFGLFMYQTMDNVDGKQARRTGTSSGLGELFDHGIDSLNCTLGSLLETAAMALGTSKSGVFTALCPCLAMFFSTWETYHTHTLYLGYFNGPTEGLLIAASVMALSGIFGPQIWTQPLAELLGERYLPGYARALAPYSIRDAWIAIIVGSLVCAHMPFCILNVVRARPRAGRPGMPVFLEWIPMAVYTLSIGAWLYSPYSTLRRENHFVLFCLTMSLVFGRMTTKMILAHLTRQPFPYWTVMLAPLVGGAVLGNLPRLPGLGLAPVSPAVEHAYLWAYFIFAAVVYFRWAYLVITSICDFLGISAFTIPREKQLENKRKRREELAAAGATGPANGKKSL